MPNETTTVSCPAPYGQGGLGRHLAEVVTAARAAGDDVRYFASFVRAADSAGTEILPRWSPLLVRFTPLRWARTQHAWLANVEFDRAVARKLPPGRRLFGFQGSALATFRRARTLGYEELHLEAAAAHVDHARRMFDAAYRVHPLERDWLGPRLLARTKAEYELADVIWINSEYSRETFVAAGIDPRKLRRRKLSVDPKYRPAARIEPHEGLSIVYVGSLSIAKGVPILIEAFSGLDDPVARLTLVGGSGSAGLRRYLDAALKHDRRISIAPGDPLPHLLQADLCVHPSYCDGYGYGPAEAMACGVPVVVTEDTGMKEEIVQGTNGWIVPTGDVFAIVDILRNPKPTPERVLER
jgi:glycosyltransferase involved in cell wall biosynthesis